MQGLRLRHFEEAVGEKFINSRKSGFPDKDWSRKTVGNVIYILVKPTTPTKKFFSYMNKLQNTSGKLVKFCVVPKGFMV